MVMQNICFISTNKQPTCLKNITFGYNTADQMPRLVPFIMRSDREQKKTFSLCVGQLRSVP